MGLRNKLDDTKFRSLKYGGDTPGGGNSGQPYIKPVDLNKVDNSFNQLRFSRFDDGLVRGGVVGALNSSVTDTIRIGKFLTDYPKGPLFITKQVGLQLSNPKIEVRQYKTDRSTTGQGLLNNIGNFISNVAGQINNAVGPTRIYNLGINTLAQVPVNAFGQHIPRHGFLPVQNEADKYINVVKENDKEQNSKLIRISRKLLYVNDNIRKGDITRLNRNQTNAVSNLLNTTNINLISQGINNFLNIQNQTIDNYISGPSSIYGLGSTVIRRYEPFLRTISEGIEDINRSGDMVRIKLTSPNFSINNIFGLSKFEKSLLNKNSFGNLLSEGKYPTTLIDKISSEKDIIKNNNSKTSLDLSKEIETKLFKKARDKQVLPSLRDSSKKKTYSVLDRKKGKEFIHPEILNGDQGITINNDYINFFFKIIDPFSGNVLKTLMFPSFITSFNDKYNSEWNEFQYIGRAEKFYTFKGFSRNINCSFKSPIFNPNKILDTHKALNYLASSTSGLYNTKNLLGGVLIRLTIGDYLVDQAGFLSLDYNIDEDTPWHVKGQDNNDPDKTGGVETQLAHIVNVNFNFTVIHDKLPQFYSELSEDNSFLNYGI